jgi:transglutaminase-like putative cysteine protease
VAGAPVRVESATSWTSEGGGGALLLVRAARAPDQRLVDERLTVSGAEVEEGPASRLGDRPVRVHAGGGPAAVRYLARVEVDGDARACPADDLPLPGPARLPFDLIEWTLPSRYCPSDTLAPTAGALFGARPRTRTLIPAVAAWVRGEVAYRPGSSDPLTAADETLLARAGVCRDMAHLAISLLRALEVPARMVAAYAPRLDPPDFHALLEAHDGTAWRLVDVTGLAPVETAVRIATGRDAADVAWATTTGGMRLDEVDVAAAGPRG